MSQASLSVTAAVAVCQEVLTAFQKAEELGGPELPEYVILTDMLMCEFKRRRDNAITSLRARALAELNEHIDNVLCLASAEDAKATS